MLTEHNITPLTNEITKLLLHVYTCVNLSLNFLTWKILFSHFCRRYPIQIYMFSIDIDYLLYYQLVEFLKIIEYWCAHKRNIYYMIYICMYNTVLTLRDLWKYRNQKMHAEFHLILYRTEVVESSFECCTCMNNY